MINALHRQVSDWGENMTAESTLRSQGPLACRKHHGQRGQLSAGLTLVPLPSVHEDVAQFSLWIQVLPHSPYSLFPLCLFPKTALTTDLGKKGLAVVLWLINPLQDINTVTQGSGWSRVIYLKTNKQTNKTKNQPKKPPKPIPVLHVTPEVKYQEHQKKPWTLHI